MAAVGRNRFSGAEYGDAVDTAHAHYRRKCTLYAVLTGIVAVARESLHRCTKNDILKD